MKMLQPSTNAGYKLGVLLLVMAGLMLACSNPAPSTPKRGLQESIHYYIFDEQPTTGAQFVRWADSNLSKYSARQVYKAIQKEASYQAKQGHPNAVGVLSFCASAWAKDKGLEYSANDWVDMQLEAKENLRELPTGEINLWPKK